MHTCIDLCIYTLKYVYIHNNVHHVLDVIVPLEDQLVCCMLQCDAVCCNVLQCVAVCCNVYHVLDVIVIG